MRKVALALVAIFALAACGGGDEEPRRMASGQSADVQKIVKAAKTGAPAGKVEQGENLSPEELSKALHEYWKWGTEGEVPPTELEDDHADCVNTINNDPTRKRRMKPIESLVLQVRCLEEKGWTQR